MGKRLQWRWEERGAISALSREELAELHKGPQEGHEGG